MSIIRTVGIWRHIQYVLKYTSEEKLKHIWTFTTIRGFTKQKGLASGNEKG